MFCCVLAATALMYSVAAVMNLTTLDRTAPTRFLSQEHHATKTDLFQGIDIPIPKETVHTPPTMITGMVDIATNNNPATIPTTRGAASSEDTHYAPHAATRAASTTLWLINALITIHAVTHPTGIVAPYPALTISSADVTHGTIPWTRAGLFQATPTTQETQPRKAMPHKRPSTPPQTSLF